LFEEIRCGQKGFLVGLDFGDLKDKPRFYAFERPRLGRVDIIDIDGGPHFGVAFSEVKS
jgi:hypothetical protein